ncbi:25S rRNA (cytosine-C(5))-methyltransferase [Venturia inaequalis]|nr:25S rRNA (cytosine-C(5))-methyltransferase [Venturia inaequalis]
MQLLSILLWSLALSTSKAHLGLSPRQLSASSTDLTSTTSPTGTASNTPSQTSSESSIQSNGSGTSSAPTPSSVPPSISATIDIPSASGTTTESVATSTSAANGTTTGDPIPLPLQPKITPAIGFAGALLMITGLAYTLVGIKNQWLYSFFGVAYLVSLATTVLILYCMNPPVSNGVQGAFLFAVIFAGSLAGGVALIFRDLADGVGCLLGGFCLAMWILCLKVGGLIPSVLGKAIFIGCMSVAVFSLAISSKTRKYGLIGSIPFSGATATILGIDCFSRAGLKEFWIYVWDINDDEFPVNTTTYPLTRGIKVEIAGIILLFLLGLTTQLKLAQVVEQRRLQKNAHRVEQAKDLEKEETAAGQRVEQDIQNERVKWEHVYGGGKSQTTIVAGTASVDTLGKGFGSVREKRISGISSVESYGMSPTREMYGSKQPHTIASPVSPKDTADDISTAGSNRHRPSATARHSARLSVGSNQGSLFAAEESHSNNKRLAGFGMSNHRRSIGTVPETTVSKEELIDDYESDMDSSVAATFDGLDQTTSEFGKDSRSDTGKPGQKAVTAENLPHDGDRRDSRTKRQSTLKDSQAPTMENLKERLPENVPNIVLQHRTNELEKHVELAEVPEQDRLVEPPSPEVKVDTHTGSGSNKERTAPSPVVNSDTSLVPARPVSKRASTTPNVQERPRTASAKKVAQSPQASPIMSRSESARAVSRPTGGQKMPPMSSTSRNSSAVKIQPGPISTSTREHSNLMFNQPLVESPIDSSVEKGRMGKMKKVGSHVVTPKATLLIQRDSQLKSKPRSRGFSSSPPNLVQGESEKMPSSQRKPQPKAGPIRPGSRQDSRPVIKQFDSHQPLRAPNAISQEKRADLLNGWHESLRQESKPQALVAQAPIGEEARMARLMQEKRRRQFVAEQEQAAKMARDNTLDHMMRNGNMMDVHKQRLRNMQAGAKIL